MTQLSPTALEAAWQAYQNTTIDLLADSDDETKRCLAAAITAYLARAEKEGWVMVPKVPSVEQVNAAGNAVADYVKKMTAAGGEVDAYDYALRAVIYRTMLAAAQNVGE